MQTQEHLKDQSFQLSPTLRIQAKYSQEIGPVPLKRQIVDDESSLFETVVAWFKFEHLL